MRASHGGAACGLLVLMACVLPGGPQVSFMRTRRGWVGASGSEVRSLAPSAVPAAACYGTKPTVVCLLRMCHEQGEACIGTVTAHVFLRTSFEKIKAKLPYPPRPYHQWLTTGAVTPKQSSQLLALMSLVLILPLLLNGQTR